MTAREKNMVTILESMEKMNAQQLEQFISEVKKVILKREKQKHSLPKIEMQ